MENDLKVALEQFEISLQTPVVPGELANWAEEVKTAFDEVADQLQRRLDRDHPDQFAQIEHDDPGLSPRVEELRTEDELLRKELEELRPRVEALANAAPAVEPDEARVDQPTEQTIRQGLALVLRARRQEVAAATWLVESLDRDRGVAD